MVDSAADNTVKVGKVNVDATKVPFTWNEPIITAGPTCGKTLLAEWMHSKGVKVVDTDDVVNVLFPAYFRDKQWRQRDTEWSNKMDLAVGTALGKIHRLTPGKVVFFTNLWGPAFRDALTTAGLIGNDGKLPFGIFRHAEDMVRASIVRGDEGGGIPLKLAKMWMSGFVKHGGDAFRASAIIRHDQYAADIWDLSAIAKRYDLKEIPGGKELGEWRRSLTDSEMTMYQRAPSTRQVALKLLLLPGASSR
jgi:hypothetical protein